MMDLAIVRNQDLSHARKARLTKVPHTSRPAGGPHFDSLLTNRLLSIMLACTVSQTRDLRAATRFKTDDFHRTGNAVQSRSTTETRQKLSQRSVQ